MAIIDPTQTWKAVEKRLAETANERHRAVLYPGAAGIGIEVDDESGDYLVVFRQLILWPIDLPQQYIDLMHAPA